MADTKAISVDRMTPGGSSYRTLIRVPVDADEDKARADFLASVDGVTVPGVVSITARTKQDPYVPAGSLPAVQTGETSDPADPVVVNPATDGPVEDATVTAGGDDIATPGPDGPKTTRAKRS